MPVFLGKKWLILDDKKSQGYCKMQKAIFWDQSHHLEQMESMGGIAFAAPFYLFWCRTGFIFTGISSSIMSNIARPADMSNVVMSSFNPQYAMSNFTC